MFFEHQFLEANDFLFYQSYDKTYPLVLFIVEYIFWGVLCFLSTVKFRRNYYYALFFYFSLGHERFIRVIKLKKLYKYKVGGLNADEDDDEDHEEEEGGDSDKEDSSSKR